MAQFVYIVIFEFQKTSTRVVSRCKRIKKEKMLMNFSMLDLSRLFQLPWSVSLNNFHDFCSKFYDFNLGDSYLNLIFVSLFEALFQCFVPIFHNFRPQVRYFSIPSQFCSIAGILRAKKVCF